MSEPQTLEKPQLEWYTKLERCDQCSAQAFYMVVFEFGNLFFCRHHYMKNEQKFFETALDIVDESELLG